MIHIAIAEDDFRVAQIHERLIKQLDGFKIIGKAANAKETLALLKEHKVDLLLLDIYMPDELGTALIPDIRSRFPEVDIMIITAATETRHLQEALRAGIAHYLIKPVTADKFRQVLLQYKEKRKSSHVSAGGQPIHDRPYFWEQCEDSFAGRGFADWH